MTFQRAFVVLVFLQLFVIAVRETLDPDMWWHLRTGEFIWKHGLPRHDIFSFTVTSHAWLTHEWLSEALMWPVYAVAGLHGLSVVFAAFIALAFWLVYRCCDGQPYLAAMVAFLGALAAAPSFGVRPQTFTLVMTAAFVSVVQRVKQRQLTRRALLLLPLLAILWANLHGGYLLSVVLLATYAVGEGLELLMGEPGERGFGWHDVRTLVVLAALCLAAALANPNGWRLWSYPFGTLGSAAMQENIAEWRSPDFHQWYYWPFAAMMGLGTASWILARNRPDWTDALLFLGTAAAGLGSVRHIALFAVVATPVVSRSLASALRGTKAYRFLVARTGSTSSDGRTAQLNWAILAIGVIAAGVWSAGRLAKNDAAIAKMYPVEAMRFLEQQGLAGKRGFNAYTWGGYLIWRGVSVFVDGRADVYGDDFLSYYFKTFKLTPDWRQPLDDFEVVYVLLERPNPLGVLLETSRQWREVYGDDVARVFVRAGGSRGLGLLND